MRRIKLILAVATAVAVMMLTAAPAMAKEHHGSANGKHGSGTFLVSSNQNFGGNHDFDSDNNIGFISSDSSFNSVEFEGSNGGSIDVD